MDAQFHGMVFADGVYACRHSALLGFGVNLTGQQKPSCFCSASAMRHFPAFTKVLQTAF